MLFSLIMYLVREKNKKEDQISEMRFGEINKKLEQNKVLSERELEVAQEVLNGLSNKQISDKLFIAIPTVKNHKGKIFKKMKCKNAIDLLNKTMGLINEKSK